MILSTGPAGLRTAPDANIPGFDRPSDQDLARWVNLAENIREEPRILTVLAKKHPEAYTEVIAGLRRLAIVARSEEWRSPTEGIGGRPEQLIPGTPGSFSARTDWLTIDSAITSSPIVSTRRSSRSASTLIDSLITSCAGSASRPCWLRRASDTSRAGSS